MSEGNKETINIRKLVTSTNNFYQYGNTKQELLVNNNTLTKQCHKMFKNLLHSFQTTPTVEI